MRLALLLLAALVLAGCAAPTTPGPVGGDSNARVDVVRVVAVDPSRWSGEPSILALQDGTLLITGAGGLTRYAEDPAAIPGNFGQSYLWRSTDQGATWAFVDLGLPEPVNPLVPYRNAVAGVEGDLAEDAAGKAYFVDLAALAANGLATSVDSGATWTETQNPAVGQPGVDRPWVAALAADEVYVKYLQTQSGHRVARSTDGGLTFPEDVALDRCGQGAPVVDRGANEVLLPCIDGDGLWVAATPGGQAMAWERRGGPVAEGDAGYVFPALAVAGPGQLLYAWAESVDDGVRVRLAASMDGGATWGQPITLSEVGHSAVFPWVDATPEGNAAVVWYETANDTAPGELTGTWFPRIALLAVAPIFPQGLAPPTRGTLSPDPVHEGGICTAGLGCVLDGRSEERRLLDFFEVDVDAAGVAHVAWTSTMTPEPTIWYGQARLAAT